MTASHTAMNFRKTLLASLLVTSILPTPNFAEGIDDLILPDMGDSSGTLITPLQEQEMGAAFFRSLHSQLEINQDPDIQQYIESIGHRLASNSDEPGNPYHFFVVLDNSVNAFAGPGGYIGINSGLILISESESELASVMGHEIAHVTQRHLMRAFEAASQLSLPTAAATLAAILLGTQSPGLGQAALMAIQAGSIQTQINFTRSNEQEADRVGMQILAESDFDPRSMPVFFERLQQSTRYYGQGIPDFLRTHPVTASRISDTRGRAEKYPYKQFPDSQGYLLAKAKLRVMTAKNIEDVLNFFKNSQNQGTPNQRAVARYGIGLIYVEEERFKEARDIFKQLTEQYPDQSQYLTALARVELERGNYPQALQLYHKAKREHPGNIAIKVEYIASLLKAGKPGQAQKELQSLGYNNQNQPVYYQLMARAYGDLGRNSESHRYMAEYYYSKGNTEAAITQIRLAKQAKDINFYLSAILDERLHFFLEEEKERKRNR